MRKSTTVLLSIFLLLSLFTCCVKIEPAQAQLNVFQLFDSYVATATSTGSTFARYSGQTFTASSTYNATLFCLMFFRQSTHGIQNMHIYNVGVNGLPSTLLVTIAGGGTDIVYNSAGGLDWINGTRASGVVLEKGKQYWIGIELPASVASGSVLGIVSPGGYAGGQVVRGSALPANTASATQDAPFMVWGYPVVDLSQDFVYNFIGPKRDAAPQGSDKVTLTLTGVDGSSAQAVVASGQTFSFSQQLAAVSWNFSSALDLTRTIEFLPSDGTAAGERDFQIFTANSEWVNGVYVFSVVDYTGEAQFLEVCLGGQVVERRNLALSGSADFTLYKGLTYTLNVVGRTGVFSQLFTAGNIYSSNIVLLAGSFGEVTLSDGRSEVFSAVWDSTGKIKIFFDSPIRTGSFNFTILKRDGAGLYPVYSGSVLSGLLPFTFLWDAEISGNYVVEGFQYSGGVLLRSWRVDVAASTAKVNPWTALLAPFTQYINTVPSSAVLPEGFEMAQVPAAIIIALVLAIFSWKNHGAGCLLCWVFAVVMVALGWFTVAPFAFGFALFVSILIVVVEGKQREREL